MKTISLLNVEPVHQLSSSAELLESLYTFSLTHSKNCFPLTSTDCHFLKYHPVVPDGGVQAAMFSLTQWLTAFLLPASPKVLSAGKSTDFSSHRWGNSWVCFLISPGIVKGLVYLDHAALQVTSPPVYC